MLLSKYLAELKKIELLTPEKEFELWQDYKDNGSLESRRKLIESYQPLVFKAAVNWRADETTIMDLVQEGTVGLIEAVENYDYRRKVAFSLYAVHRIRGRIINYIKREGKGNLTYIDSPLENNDEVTLAECLVDTAPEVARQVEHSYLVEQVKNAIGRLSEKERAVLSGVFLEEREPSQLAETLDVSISHIYRLQKQGIRRVRGMLAKLMQHW